MYTATIHTQTRILNIPCENNRDEAISALQQAVYMLTEEDGRCRFVVAYLDNEVYSWEYQPTFRKDLKKRKNITSVKKEPEYFLGYIIYVLKNGLDLSYDNFYADGQIFDSAIQAHEFMKERGYNKHDYRLVYEYGLSDDKNDYGFGLGFTKAEAKENLNERIAEYNLIVMKNGKVKAV